jgi:hypothetical protein
MADLTSKYQRVFAVTPDKYGVDALRDKLIPYINNIKNYTMHRILQDERGAPDLISEREYNSDEFWWIIMAYNGISSYRKLVEGMTIRIPSLTEVVSIVTENSIRPNSVKRVITI